MSIDWLTVAAQIVNFLVLVWLLRRFLYRPILDGIDARETEIATRMGEARQVRASAEEAGAHYAAQLSALEAEQSDVLKQARAEAQRLREEAMAQMRAELAEERAALTAQRRKEAENYAHALQKAGAAALLEATRRALRDLADESLEDRLAAHVAARLDERAEELRAAAGTSRDAIVTSHAPLSEAARARLAQAIAARLPGTEPQFRSDPAQSPGILLRIGGAQVGWTIDGYLHQLGALLEERLPAASGTGARGATRAGDHAR